MRKKQHLSFPVQPVTRRIECLLFLTLFHWCRFTPERSTFPCIDGISTPALCVGAWGRWWLAFHLLTSGWTQRFFCRIWNFRQGRQNISMTLLFQQVGFCTWLMNISFSLHMQVAARDMMHFIKFLLTMRWNWRASPSQRQWGILVWFGLNLHLFLFPFWAEDTKYPKEIKPLVPKDKHKPNFPCEVSWVLQQMHNTNDLFPVLAQV